jgi:hypothetical protein
MQLFSLGRKILISFDLGHVLVRYAVTELQYDTLDLGPHTQHRRVSA